MSPSIWVGNLLYLYGHTLLDDLTVPVVLEDGRVAILLREDQWQEGTLVVFAQQDGTWLIDEVVRITEEPRQAAG